MAKRKNKASQNCLADEYHTTKRKNSELILKGEVHVVGVDCDETEEKVRYIYFHIINPQNEGGVLIGRSFAPGIKMEKERLTELAEREARIVILSMDKSVSEEEGAERAKQEVEAVIKEGGMLRPSVKAAREARQLEKESKTVDAVRKSRARI